MKSKKTLILVLFIVLIIALGIGYASFSDALTITGTANAKGTFDVEFSSASVVDSKGVRTTGENPTGVSISADKNTLDVTVADLSYPGAGAQFQAVIKNVGSVPAKVSSVEPTNITGNGNAIKITGLDEITADHPTLQPGGTCTVNFTVEWDKDVTTLSDAVAGEDCNFTLVVNYVQDTEDFTGTASHTDVNP